MTNENPQSSVRFSIEPANPPNDGILFVDNSVKGRSGHLGHALVEYEPGKILAFCSNCSAENSGHNGDGWMDFRRSVDGGRTWSEAQPLEYSKRVYDSGKERSVMCEKAILAQDGSVLLFNLECVNSADYRFTWRPLFVPTVMRSTDGGETWQGPMPVGDEPGRIWDVISHEGEIYALELANDTSEQWYGTQPDHHYSLYVSSDDGHSFSRRSLLPFDFDQRGYGALTILPNGSLIAYVYNQHDEMNLDYSISEDQGRTWTAVRTAHFAKQIRNPQIARFAGGYVLHGRSGSKGDVDIRGHFVLYTSDDGIHWDEGQFLKNRTTGPGAYSNNLLLHNPDGQPSGKLLIQASHAYEQSKTNVYHWFLGPA